MNSTSLRGIFPQPKPVQKKNFVKENVRYIKHMQGIIQHSNLFEPKQVRSKPLKPGVQSLTAAKLIKPLKKKPSVDADKMKLRLNTPVEDKHSHRAVQTESPESMEQLYEQGVIKYPSPSVLNAIETAKKNLSPRKKDFKKQRDQGDGIVIENPHNNELNSQMQTLEVNERHNYIKENILALKQKLPKQDSNQDPMSNYQKGVLPKYLRDRKDEQKKEVDYDQDCPEGHVLLPDEERKETLRVLRQSYADRIQELNSMPVRNDTLKMRKRKMAIEEELKKIDEGIKVFQRPKVFVKINM